MQNGQNVGGNANADAVALRAAYNQLGQFDRKALEINEPAAKELARFANDFLAVTEKYIGEYNVSMVDEEELMRLYKLASLKSDYMFIDRSVAASQVISGTHVDPTQMAWATLSVECALLNGGYMDQLDTGLKYFYGTYPEVHLQKWILAGLDEESAQVMVALTQGEEQ